MPEVLTLRAITFMEQSMEESYVPTAISMVLSGLGIEVSEQILVDRYFPTARLPGINPSAGVSNTNIVRGLIRIREDLGLVDQLRIDVFCPMLYAYTRSSEEKYIVEVEPRTLRRYGRGYGEGSEVGKFYKTLEQLLKAGEIGVWTANGRMTQYRKKENWWWDVPEIVTRGFYDELSNFISKGHVIGSHGGLTMHTRVLDGTRRERLTFPPGEEGYVVLDPRGESWAIALRHLIYVDSVGGRGDLFDYLYRVSPREEDLKLQSHSLARILSDLRERIPDWVPF